MSFSGNAIKEANEQIMLMHSRMQEMEKQTEALKLQLVEKERLCTENSSIPLEIQQSLSEKDAEIHQLRSDLRDSKAIISNLEQELFGREVFMEKLQSKSKILDEIVGFRGSLEGLLSYMKIVEDMERKQLVSDVNENLRETEITDGYNYRDEEAGRTSVVHNGHPDHDVAVEHV